MKKIALASLLLAASAVVGFAQDAAKPAPALKLSGYLNVGIDGDFSSSNTDSYVYAHDEDFGGYGPVFKLVGKYDADTWGYKFRLRDRGGFDANHSTATYINYVYGWFKPYEGVTVFAGKLGDGTISGLDPEGDAATFYLDGGEVVYSIGDLSVGAAAGKADSSPATGQDDGLLGAYMIQYSLPKLFTVEAHVTTGYESWDGPEMASLPTNAVGGYAVTGSFDAIEGLTLTAGYNAYLVSGSARDYTLVDGSVFYTIDKVTVGGKVWSHKSKDYGDYVRILPSVAYALTDAFSLGANVDIYTADGYDDSFWGNPVITPEGKTAIPAVTATYAVGGATTTASLGYDVGNKVTKTYIDFIFSF